MTLQDFKFHASHFVILKQGMLTTNLPNYRLKLTAYDKIDIIFAQKEILNNNNINQRTPAQELICD